MEALMPVLCQSAGHTAAPLEESIRNILAWQLDNSLPEPCRTAISAPIMNMAADNYKSSRADSTCEWLVVTWLQAHPRVPDRLCCILLYICYCVLHSMQLAGSYPNILF